MKSLIIKDLLMIKGNLKAFFVILIFYFMMMFNDSNISFFIIPFFGMILAISTFSYDEFNKWDTYAITLPVKRKDIVKSKYISSSIMIGISTICSFLLLIIMQLSTSSINLENVLSMSLGSIAGAFLTLAIIYPLMYKFGSTKGRIYIFGGTVILSFLLGLIIKLLEKTKINFQNLEMMMEHYWFLLIPLSILLILWISYQISKRIYYQKEF